MNYRRGRMPMRGQRGMMAPELDKFGQPLSMAARSRRAMGKKMGKQAGKVIIVLLIVAAIIAVGIFVYKKLAVQHNDKTLMKYMVKATQPMTISNKKIPVSEYGNEYTLSFWMFVNDWALGNREAKSVLYRGDENAIATNPGVWFYPHDNTLKVAFQLQSFKPTMQQINLMESCPNSMNPKTNPNFMNDHTGTCDIKDVPLQRWNHICISIWNQSVDMYLNGRLVKTCAMPEYPVPSGGNLYVGHQNGFNGFISSINYYPRILIPSFYKFDL